MSLRPYVPAKNFNTSILFYEKMGMEKYSITDELCLMTSEVVSFYLQNFYVKDLAENLMFELSVTDFDGLYVSLTHVTEGRADARLSDIINKPYGKEFHLWDPSGVLWTIRPKR